MNKKILSLMAALVLMLTTFVPVTKALAQGLVEYAIILVLAAFNKNTESAELVWVPRPSQANPSPNEAHLVTGYDFIIDVASTVDPTCTQTFQASVETIPGPNVMTLEIISNLLVVNGKEVDEEELNGCFGDRLLIAVKKPVPPDFDLTALPAGFQKPEFVSANIVGKDGTTHSSVSWSKTLKANDRAFDVLDR